MKRYTIGECDQFYLPCPEEDPEGEWVRYEDVKALIEAEPGERVTKAVIDWKERIKERIEDLLVHLIIEGYCTDYDDRDEYLDLLNHVTKELVNIIETGGRET